MEAKLKRKHDACVDGGHGLSNHAADFIADTPLQDLLTTLNNSLGKIDNFETLRLHNLGFEAQLLQDLKTMSGEGWAISKIVEEFAKANHNATLEHLVAFHKSDFSGGTYDDRKTHATVVFNAATANVLAMVTAGYNITAIRVTGLGTAINDFTTDQGAPRADIADTVAAHDAEVAEIKNVLMPTRQSILNLMVSYALPKPLFYNSILDSFEILDIGKRFIADRVRVFDSVLNLRLGKALVTVNEIPTLPKKNSSELGIVDFSHQNLPQGNYTFVVSLKGYGTITITNVPSDDSKMTLVNVPLEKNGANKTVDFNTLPQGHAIIN